MLIENSWYFRIAVPVLNALVLRKQYLDKHELRYMVPCWQYENKMKLFRLNDD